MAEEDIIGVTPLGKCKDSVGVCCLVDFLKVYWESISFKISYAFNEAPTCFKSL